MAIGGALLQPLQRRLGDRYGLAVGVAVGLFVAIFLFAIGEREALVLGTIAGASYGLLGLGLVLVYKSSGIFNFAQGEFGTVAVFALYLATTNGVPYVFAVLIALLVAAVFGFLTERAVIRPLAGAPRVTLLVATAGVSLLAIGLEFWIAQPEPRQVAAALPRQDRVSIFGIFISDQRLLIFAAIAIIAAALAYFFSRTNLGLAVLAASQEPTATNLVGISVDRISTLVWVLAAVLGGMAGVLTAPLFGFTPAFLTTTALVPAFTAAVIGGFTSLPGAFLGGVIVGVAQSLASSLDLFESVPGPQTASLFALLVLILLFRPQGLLGRT
jgi:branched-chain amino acid transport system permease protein